LNETLLIGDISQLDYTRITDKNIAQQLKTGMSGSMTNTMISNNATDYDGISVTEPVE